jgi:hypothetical protein
MNLHFGLKQAKGELQHLNVEIRRLVTFMCDDHADYYHAIQRWLIADPPLAHKLSIQWSYCNAIHEKIFWRLQQTARLKGFSGQLAPGRCLGRHQDECLVPNLPLWLQQLYAVQGYDDGWEDEEESGGSDDGDVEGLVRFMDDLDM